MVLRHCSSCGEEREFETPPCVDGHGLDCPELACITCGAAVFVGSAPLVDLPGRASPAEVGGTAAVGTAA